MHNSAGSTFKHTVLLSYYRLTIPLEYSPPSGGFFTPASTSPSSIVRMEALTAKSVALLNIYDILKVVAR